MEECCWNNDSNFIGCQTIRSHKSLEDSVCKRIESSTTSIQETPLATGQLHAEIAALQEQIRYLTLANDILISGQAVLLEHIRNLTSEQAVFLRNLTESQSNRSCGQNPGDRFDIWILVTVNVSLIVFILGIGAYQNRNRLKELVCRKQNQRPEIGKDADGTDHDRRRRYLGGHELAPTSANIQIRRDSESSSDC
ncbi:uncharacterized protein LOC106011020 [Aplysia californica]|uniref:Uncharacterized protein LOC106011020 n=1 Tax=Aplysia californica TaxID=6500 RepID=A0ABM0ZUA2_APLCA|nr:uncharacterized protein LOC106011020 [Aplysia californica]